jgi:uncharacterized protein (TIGR00290 family)
MLWTGGKDSSLAFYEAGLLSCKINCLVTFVWNQEAPLAHPLDFIGLQAQALGLPHLRMDVAEPYDEGYEKAISALKEQHGIETLVTGDIDEVTGHDPNWIVERAARHNVKVIRPLWQRDRLQILNKLLALRFKVAFSCVKKPWFTDQWLGRELSATAVKELVKMSQSTGLDVCGEQGEYHTLALDAPQFKKRIRIESYSKRSTDSVMYLALEKIRLEEKTDS